MSEQTAIVYDKPGDCNTVYDTAYGLKQAKQAVRHCASRYGYRSNVRVLSAKQVWEQRR